MVVSHLMDPNKWHQCGDCQWWGRCDRFAADFESLTALLNGRGGIAHYCSWCDPFAFPEHEWKQCRWCGWWGLYGDGDDPDHDEEDCIYGGANFEWSDPYLCFRCKQYGLDEPPWWPNNRDRHLMVLQRFKFFPELPDNVVREVACYLATNTP